jgi:hypothetical protein
LKEFWNWVLTDGRDTASTLGYTVMPAEIAGKVSETLASIR